MLIFNLDYIHDLFIVPAEARTLVNFTITLHLLKLIKSSCDLEPNFRYIFQEQLGSSLASGSSGRFTVLSKWIRKLAT